jgi:hypothetical protein
MVVRCTGGNGDGGSCVRLAGCDPGVRIARLIS